MTAIRLLVLAVAVAFGAARYDAPAAETDNGDKPILHVFTWEEYFDSNVVNEFQKKYGCEVSLDYYDSNDAIYHALATQGGGYDLVTPSAPVAESLQRKGLLLQLDHGKLPNLKNIDRKAFALALDPQMKYSVPYTQTFTGIGYNTAKVHPSTLAGWEIFANPAYADKMSLLNDMREVLGAALKTLGHSLNTTSVAEIEEAGRVVAEWEKNIAALGLEPALEGLKSGELLVIHAYDGDIAAAMADNPHIGFFIPGAGTVINSDAFVIPADSPIPDLAYAFINHMLDSEMAKRNMEGIYYYMPNAAALELLHDGHFFKSHDAFNVPPGTLAKCEVVKDLGEDNAKYEKVWKTVMGDKLPAEE